MSQHIRNPDRPDKYRSFELSKKAEIVKCLANGTMKVAEVAREYGLPIQQSVLGRNKLIKSYKMLVNPLQRERG